MLNELRARLRHDRAQESQGSEYRAVVLCVGKAGPMLLQTRGVLYTAITRARALLIHRRGRAVSSPIT